MGEENPNQHGKQKETSIPAEFHEADLAVLTDHLIQHETASKEHHEQPSHLSHQIEKQEQDKHKHHKGEIKKPEEEGNIDLKLLRDNPLARYFVSYRYTKEPVVYGHQDPVTESLEPPITDIDHLLFTKGSVGNPAPPFPGTFLEHFETDHFTRQVHGTRALHHPKGGSGPIGGNPHTIDVTHHVGLEDAGHDLHSYVFGHGGHKEKESKTNWFSEILMMGAIVFLVLAAAVGFGFLLRYINFL